MLKSIGLQEKFSLVFKIKKEQLTKVQDILKSNGMIYTAWQQLPMQGYLQFRVNVNLRQAEVVRQLLKNFNLYD